jgi:uncharacterized protein involved in outer membrane biogenesis
MRLAFKILASIIVLVAVTLGGAIIFLTVADDDFYRGVMRDLVEGQIDRKIRADGSFSFEVGLQPTLIVTDLWIENAPWAERREMVRVDRAEIQIALTPLLSGILLVPRLVLEGVQIDLERGPQGQGNWQIAEAGGGRRPGPRSQGAFYPLFDFISLKDVTITYRESTGGWAPTIFLESLQKLKSDEDEGIPIDGRGRINDNDFEIAGRLGSLEAALAATAPFPLDLSLKMPGFAAALSGTAENLPRGRGFNLDLSVQSSSVGDLQVVWGLERTAEGRANATARLSGDLGSLALTELDLDVALRSGIRFHAEGSFADLIAGTGLDVRLTGDIGPQAKLTQRLPAFLRDFETLDFGGRLTGSRDGPGLEDFRTSLTYASGARLGLNGGLSLDLSEDRARVTNLRASTSLSLPDPSLLEAALETDLPAFGALQADATFVWKEDQLLIEAAEAHVTAVAGLRLTATGVLGGLAATGEVEFMPAPQVDLSAEMAETGPLVSLFGADLPELGPVRASARLSGAEDVYRFEDVRLMLGTRDAVWLEAEGAIGPIRPGGPVPLERVAAKAHFGWPSSAAFSQLLGGKTIPDLGAASGRFVLEGPPEALRVTDAHLETTRSDGLTGTAVGGIASLALFPEFAFKGLEFDIEARSETTETVAQLAGHELPELGAVRASARLSSQNGRFALTGIVASAGPQDQPLFQVAGEIDDAVSLTGTRLTGEFETQTARLLEFLEPAAAQALGRIAGSFVLSDADGSLGIEDLTIAVSGSDLLSLSMEGAFGDLAHRDTLGFQASLTVPDPAALGRAFGLEGLNLAPLDFEGRVAGSVQRFQADGDARVGNTPVSATITGSLAAKRPAFRARLHTPLIHLADFGLAPEAEASQAGAGQKSPDKRAQGAQLFDEDPLPFEALYEMDLDFELVLDEIDGISFDANKAEVHLVLDDGLLTIDQLRFNLVGGYVEMSGVADVRQAEPELQLQIAIDELDLGDLLGQMETDVPVDGAFNLILDVKAAGHTPRALASSLTGDISIAVERGHIRSRLFAFTALDLSSWMFSKSTRKGYSKINCFIARFAIDEGVAKTQMLLLDTKNARTSGTGNINFRKETIKLHMDPQPKSKRIAKLTTPFSIEGPLASPTVQVSTTGAAVRTLSEIVLTPINTLGGLLPFVSDSGKDKDNPCLVMHDEGGAESGAEPE